MSRILFVEGWAVPRRVLVVLAVAAFVELLTMALRTAPLADVGFVGLPWAVVPCAIAVGVVANYPHRRKITITDARAFAYVALLVLGVVFGGLYVTSNGWGVTLAIIAAVSVEEVVYRFAVPVLVALGLQRFGVPQRNALLAGIALSVGLFALMPGHLAQLNSFEAWSALVAFSVLMSHAVWRGKSLFAPVVAHAIYDFATIGMQDGDISSLLRVAGAAATLFAMVIIAAHPKVRVIDIREPASGMRQSEGIPQVLS
jgi:hypothetical protein